MNTDYSVKKGYEWLIGEVARVAWFPGWFIAWIIAQEKLLTQVRLIKMGVAVNNVCYFCVVLRKRRTNVYSLIVCTVANAGRSRQAVAMIITGRMYQIWNTRTQQDGAEVGKTCEDNATSAEGDPE